MNIRYSYSVRSNFSFYVKVSSPTMSPPRRKCRFNAELQRDYPFMKPKSSTVLDIVYCEICKSEVDISNSGRSNIKAHLLKKKHKLAANATAISNKLQTFFKSSQVSSENMMIAAKEGTFAYHTIKHMQSFRSLDCTSKLISNLFDIKFNSARTKSEAIVKNIFAEESKSRLDVAIKKVDFISIIIDSSNHGDIKLVPLLVRYFDSEKGIEVKLLRLCQLPGETSDQLHNYVFEVLEKYKISNKVIGLAADNTNTNFGGMKRKGTNNLFTKLNNSCGKSLIGVGCTAHILNNCIQNATDVLPIDIEVIAVKIFKHFYIYTVRVEKLKSFADFVNCEYKKILSFSKTRFLNMMPAIERILQMYEPLKSYFQSIDNCPTIIKQFFNNPVSEVWMWFVHNVASQFHEGITNIEGNKVSATEAALEYFTLKNKLEHRLNEVFLPLKVRECLSKLNNDGQSNMEDFKTQVQLFYSNCVSYLNNWSSNLKELKLFEWAGLRRQFNWNDVSQSVETFRANLGEVLNEDQLFDEVGILINFLSVEKINKWNSEDKNSEDRWVEMFKCLDADSAKLNNLKKLCEFVFCLPGTSAAVERLFSIINNYWSSEKSQMSVSTVESVMQVYTNFDETCNEMFHFLQSNPSMLKSILGSEKYDWFKKGDVKKDNQFPSTSAEKS